MQRGCGSTGGNFGDDGVLLPAEAKGGEWKPPWILVSLSYLFCNRWIIDLYRTIPIFVEPFRWYQRIKRSDAREGMEWKRVTEVSGNPPDFFVSPFVLLTVEKLIYIERYRFLRTFLFGISVPNPRMPGDGEKTPFRKVAKKSIRYP